mmetsp:Transcript_47713/g.107519  ORF Transcript_47713/g.107519 Transcript_47713/m.107519 type:complete len:97 (-) Transcript_47713:109-399(-)
MGRLCAVSLPSSLHQAAHIHQIAYHCRLSPGAIGSTPAIGNSPVSTPSPTLRWKPTIRQQNPGTPSRALAAAAATRQRLLSERPPMSRGAFSYPQK